MTLGDTRPGSDPGAELIPRSWVGIVNRTFGRIGMVATTLGLVTTSSAFVGDNRASQLPGLWILIGSQVVIIGCFASLANAGPSQFASNLASLSVVLGLVGAISLTWADAPAVARTTAAVLPALAIVAVQMVNLLMFEQLAWTVLVSIVVLPLYVASQAIASSYVPGQTLDACLISTGIALAAGLFANALRNGAKDADAAMARRREARADAAMVSNAQLADGEGRRLIHDRVLGALRVVEAGTDPGRTTAAARSALTALDGLNPVVTVNSLADEFGASSDPKVEVEERGWPFAPPPRVVAAMRDAAGEAIRNAARHGGVDDVHVRLASTRAGQAQLIVRDRGTGFDTKSVPGFGLSESIRGRMQQVGGDVTVTSSPGHGTVVDLVWPHASRSRTKHASRGIRGANRTRLYLLTLGPAAVINLALVARHASVASHPASVVVAAIIMTVAFVVCTVFIGRSRPNWPLVLSAALLNCAVTWLLATVTNGPEAPPLTSPDVAFSALLICLLALEVRFSQLAVLVLAELGTIATFGLYYREGGILEPVGEIVTVAGTALITFSLSALLRREYRAVVIDEALSLAYADEYGWEESSESARRHYADQLQDDVAPFLREIAAREAVPTAGEREQAVALSAQCRDLLLRADPMPSLVRAAVLTARRKGVTVNIRDAGPGDALASDSAAWRLLHAVLENAGGDVEAVTLIPARPGAPARVVTIPQTPPTSTRQILRSVPELHVDVDQSAITTVFDLVSPEWATSLPACNGL